MSDQEEIRGDRDSLERQLIKSKRWNEALGSAAAALFMILAIGAFVVHNNAKKVIEDSKKEMEPLQARIEECRAALSIHATVDSGPASTATLQQLCPPPPECPPAPECPTTELDECRRELNWRTQRVDLGEWYAQQKANVVALIKPLREKYDRLFVEIQPVILRGRELGLGPRVREWIQNLEAVKVYIELGSRLGELERVHWDMEAKIQAAQSMADRVCYDNVRDNMSEALPDARAYEDVREVVNALAADRFGVWLYTQDLVRRERE